MKSLFATLFCIVFSIFCQAQHAKQRSVGNQKNVGNHNINIGKIVGPVIINSNSKTDENYHTLRILVNTKAIIFVDGDSIGIAEIDRPFKTKLKTGNYRIQVKSEQLLTTLTKDYFVNDTALNGKANLVFDFDIASLLRPIQLTDDGKYGYLNIATGEVALPFVYDNAAHFSEGLAAVEKDDAWGYIDLKGKMVIQPIYGYAYSFFGGRAIVNDGAYYIIDKKGAKISFGFKYFKDKPNADDDYEEYDPSELEFVAQKYSGLWGIIDGNGAEKLSFLFAGIKNSATLVLVKGITSETHLPADSIIKLSKWGALYKSYEGKYIKILPCVYDTIINVADDHFRSKMRFIVREMGQWKMIDGNTSVLYELKYDQVQIVNDRICKVRQGRHEGLVEYSGKVVIPVEFDSINCEFYHSQACRAWKSGKCGYFSSTGQQITNIEFVSADTYRDLTLVGRDNKCELIDKSGNVVLSNNFNCAIHKFLPYDLNTTFEILCANNKYGIIDNNGKTIIDFKYDYIYNDEKYEYCFDKYTLSWQILLVRKSGLYGFITSFGNAITPCIYEDANEFPEDFQVTSVKLNEHWLLLNKAGQVVDNGLSFLSYKSPFCVLDGYLMARNNGKCYYFDTDGKCLLCK